MRKDFDSNDSLLIDRASAAVLIATPRSSRILLWLVALFVIAAIIWASLTSLDQVTVAQGRVIPSSHIQTIQHLEGGILKKLLVAEGDIVTAGQALLTLDQTRFQAELSQYQQESASLLLASARIKAQIAWLTQYVKGINTKPVMAQLPEIDPLLVQMQQLLYRQQQDLTAQILTIKTQVDGFNSQIEQKAQDIVELETRIAHLKSNYQLGREEYVLTAPLVAQGAISKVELIKLKRQVLSFQQELESGQLQLPKSNSALLEAKIKREAFIAKQLSDFSTEISQKDNAYFQSKQSIVSLADRLERSTVYASIAGTVKTIHITTQGGIIMPGMDLIEIVPGEDNLLIEAFVSPRDIGFLQPGLTAVIRFSAFDFAIYGSLQGTLEQISADTTADQQGNHRYKVKVRTTRNFLGTSDQPMHIIPGMAATVDLITGKKTILNYLLKPIIRAKQQALRER